MPAKIRKVDRPVTLLAWAELLENIRCGWFLLVCLSLPVTVFDKYVLVHYPLETAIELIYHSIVRL